MQLVLVVSLALGLSSFVSASYNNTKDIYCKPQAPGTCTLTLHLGASADKLQTYWNMLAGLNSTEVVNGTKTNATSRGHTSKHSTSKMVLSGSYDAILTFLTKEAGMLRQKRRSVVRHAHDSPRFINSSIFQGDVALVHDHQCNPLSRVPATNLTDSTLVKSFLEAPVKFKLYQPGSTHGRLGTNFIFEYGNKIYQDMIGTDAGLARGDDHPCTCYAASGMCPDGSERCCSCRFVCAG